MHTVCFFCGGLWRLNVRVVVLPKDMGMNISNKSLLCLVWQLNNCLNSKESNNQSISWLHIQSAELRPVSCWSYLETSCREPRVTADQRWGGGQVRGGSFVSCTDVSEAIMIIAATCDVSCRCCLFIVSLAAAVGASGLWGKMIWLPSSADCEVSYFILWRRQLSNPSLTLPRSVRQLLIFMMFFLYFGTLIKKIIKKKLSPSPPSVPPSALVFLCFVLCFFLRRGGVSR